MTATAQPGVLDAVRAAPHADVEHAPNLTPPPGNPRFPLFDSLRAIAALCVFAGHTVTGTVSIFSHPRLFGWAVQLADAGVAIFFLISGFLLYRPFVSARRDGHPLRLSDYARRRILRIVPAYWVALTLLIALGLVSGVSSGNWWIFFGFGQIYQPTTIGHGIGVAWTLCVEMSFYAMLPLFALVAGWLGGRSRRHSVRGELILLGLLATASLVYRAHYSNFLQAQKVSTLAGTFFWFALGMGLAVASISARGRAPLGRRWPLMSWAAAALLFALLLEIPARQRSIGTADTNVLLHVLYGLTALLILLPAVFGENQGGPVRALLRWRPLAWVGLISYAFYLYHVTVIAELNKLFGGVPLAAHWLFVAISGLVLSLACAAVSYYVLERPVMRWGRAGERRVSAEPDKLTA